MQERVLIYRSFRDGLRDLDDQTYRRLMTAILDYGLDEVEPDLSGLEKTVFEAWKASVDSANRRAKNGERGGRPKSDKSENTEKISEPPLNDDKKPMVTEEKPLVTTLKPTETETDTETDTETETETETGKDKRAREPKHRFGEYKNVMLTDKELEKLMAEFPDDWKDRVERLSEYVQSKGVKYKDHLATIRSWARRDQKDKGVKLNGNGAPEGWAADYDKQWGYA